MTQKYEKVFITVGTTRFDLLCETIMLKSTLNALKNIGCKQVTFQIGNSDFEPGDFEQNGIKFHAYRFKDFIQDDIRESHLVISHAGAGSCLEILEAQKPLLVVVNEELMDNHQLELAEQLQTNGYLYYCTCEMLYCTLQELDFGCLIPFPKPDSTKIVKYLDSVFVTKCNKSNRHRFNN